MPTDMTDSAVGAAAPDVSSLLAEYREIVMPAAVDFLENQISADELRERWRPYYYGIFSRYDLTVERSWRASSGSDGRLESGRPEADPRFDVPLAHFPVSTAHNNLDRLVEVLAIELGDRTIDQTEIYERKVDFAAVITKLDELMASLAS